MQADSKIPWLKQLDNKSPEIYTSPSLASLIFSQKKPLMKLLFPIFRLKA